MTHHHVCRPDYLVWTDPEPTHDHGVETWRCNGCGKPSNWLNVDGQMFHAGETKPMGHPRSDALGNLPPRILDHIESRREALTAQPPSTPKATPPPQPLDEDTRRAIRARLKQGMRASDIAKGVGVPLSMVTREVRCAS